MKRGHDEAVRGVATMVIAKWEGLRYDATLHAALAAARAPTHVRSRLIPPRAIERALVAARGCG